MASCDANEKNDDEVGEAVEQAFGRGAAEVCAGKQVFSS